MIFLDEAENINNTGRMPPNKGKNRDQIKIRCKDY